MIPADVDEQEPESYFMHPGWQSKISPFGLAIKHQFIE